MCLAGATELLDMGDRLAELRESGLHRRLSVVEGAQGPEVVLDGRPVLLLCSNNYLGLADHPAVRRSAADAALEWGASAGASRLISGTMALHGELERSLAEFKRRPSALLFGSGYLANTGTIAALAGEGELIASDELNHASIIDGCRLAKADTFVYRHADVEHLEWGLRRSHGRATMIVTDGVFSMDGDVAPLPELAELARRHRCRLVVDEAHGTGCLGPGGRGSVAAAGLEDEVDVLIGTLGKALGGYGAYVCGSAELTEFLVNSARPFIFSTALPPPAVAAASAALEVLIAHPRRVERLAMNARVLRDGLLDQGLPVGPGDTQIVPVTVGSAKDATALCARVLERGVFAQAIRPPTVPAGTSRLRMTAMATHKAGDLRRAAEVVGDSARELGLLSAAQAAEADEPVVTLREAARLPAGEARGSAAEPRLRRAA
jgi:8-amino-7-oxononanoate synthase